jgi:hypothetical protein
LRCDLRIGLPEDTCRIGKIWPVERTESVRRRPKLPSNGSYFQLIDAGFTQLLSEFHRHTVLE